MPFVKNRNGTFLGFELRNIYAGFEYINADFQTKSELTLNTWFLIERSVTVLVKTEWNAGAALLVDWLYEHLCAEEKT
jgi:hypothetical protein